MAQKTRKSDVSSMSRDDLVKQMEELGKELMKLKSQSRMGTAPENPGRIRMIKRMTARMLTSMKNKKGGAGKA